MTGCLTAAVAGVGAGLALLVPSHPLLPEAPGRYEAAIWLIALAILFFVTELGQALVEFRNQAYSFSLSGIPLLVGLLYCPPDRLLLVRVGAAGAAFAVQRAGGMKFAYNTAAYLLDSVLVILLAHHLAAGNAALDLPTALRCYAALAVVDAVMSALVLLVIHINGGPLSRRDALEVLGPAQAFVALNTAIGFLAAVLLSSGSLGVSLLAAVTAVTAGIYRGYLVLRRRHQSLQVVQAFIESSEGPGDVTEVAGRLLQQIRELVRASRVELVLRDVGGDADARYEVDDSGQAHVFPLTGRRVQDVDVLQDLPGHPVLVRSTSREPSHRAWLRRNGALDAAVVPVSRAGASATLIAFDRLGDTTTFTDDDLSLLSALAGHLTVALQSNRLVSQLRHEATHDALTGLANRTLLSERLRELLASRSGPDVGGAAVLLLDLDRFKEVNDALGHHVGDQLLQVVASRIVALDVPNSLVARLGGDEFAILLDDVDELAAAETARAVVEAVRGPVELPEATVSTEATVGVAVPGPEHDEADVLRHADTAMYAGKAARRPVTVYRPELDAGRADRLNLLAELHLAIDRGELLLHYQPKLDLAYNVVTGVEALLRWQHPRLGLVPPDVFIPLAESTGVIDRLTDAVLAGALRQCRAWNDQGLDLTVAVNLSARNVLDTALPDRVAKALVDAGVPAQRLILEITESSVMGDPERTVPTLERLTAIGVTLSLDDFGTGYSSLSYLQRLPVREVKIDRSFVQYMRGRDDRDPSEVLVRSIINLGMSLGLRIVAEGVETAEVLTELTNLGCDVAQGYHIARPVPPEELTERFRSLQLPTFHASLVTTPQVSGDLPG